MPKVQRPLADKFWERVIVETLESCWMFNNSKHGNRGYIYHDGRLLMAHRVSWIVNFGEIPAGKVICHRCDNRVCVNPNHLFIGTQADNVSDMISKGRQAPPEKTKHVGESNGRSKLSDNDRRRIVELRRSGELRIHLAEMFGIHESQVYRICKSYGLVSMYPKKWTTKLRKARCG